MDKFNPQEDGTSNSVVLRRPSKSILSAKVSIPRVSINPCDKCGHRLSRVSKYQEAHESYSKRPHSFHVDHDNYLYLQQIDEKEFLKLKRKSMNDWSMKNESANARKARPKSCCVKPEHIYEEVNKSSHMKTLDIKIKHTKDIKRASEDFCDNENDPTINTLASDSSEKADSEFQFFDSTPNLSVDKIEEEKKNVFAKVKKLVTRMTSIVNS